MSIAVVCAAFDPATDALIEMLRREIENAGQRVRRAHRPHLTLGAVRVPDIDKIVNLADAVAERHTPIALTMAALGSFGSGVLFVAPERSDALRDLQRDAHETLVDAGWPAAFGEQSDPAGWVAHCTLATRVWRGSLPGLVQRPFRPFPATLDALAVILVGGHGDVAHLPLRG